MTSTGRYKVGALFQAGAFFVSLLALAIVFYIRFQMFVVHDPPIQLSAPPAEGSTMEIGLHVNSFTKFDVIKNNFVMEAMVWFVFDPQLVDLETIGRFDVVHGHLIHKAKPVIHKFGDKTAAQYDVRITFETFLNYKFFPIDDHQVRMGLTNHFLPNGMYFSSIQNDITISENLFLPGWKIKSYDVNTGLSHIDLVRGEHQFGIRYPEAIFSFSCERTDPSIVVNILLTLFLILFMSLLTFSTDEDSVLVVSVIIVALIGYRAVMLSLGPMHISYFMLSDYMYLISLAASVLTLLAGIFSRDERVDLQTKKWFIIGIYGWFVGACSFMSIFL